MTNKQMFQLRIIHLIVTITVAGVIIIYFIK